MIGSREGQTTLFAALGPLDRALYKQMGLGVLDDTPELRPRPLLPSDFTDRTNYARYRTCLCTMQIYGLDNAWRAFKGRIQNYRAATIHSYLQVRDQEQFLGDLNAMYRSRLDPMPTNKRPRDMYDPDSATAQTLGMKVSHPAATNGFRDFGIAFRGDDRPPRVIYSEGFRPKTWPNNLWAAKYGFNFTDTILDPVKHGDQVFWANGTEDIASETAVCFTRNVVGAVAFPGAERDPHNENRLVGNPHLYVYAVHIDTAFDTESQQIDSGARQPFAPGEKAVQSIAPYNVLGHALCWRRHWETKFTLEYGFVELPNHKFWSVNPHIDLFEAERMYLDSVFSGGGSHGAYREHGDHWAVKPPQPAAAHPAAVHR